MQKIHLESFSAFVSLLMQMINVKSGENAIATCEPTFKDNRRFLPTVQAVKT